MSNADQQHELMQSPANAGTNLQVQKDNKFKRLLSSLTKRISAFWCRFLVV